MEAITPMFTNQTPPNLGKPQLTCHAFRAGEGELTVALYDKCLI